MLENLFCEIFLIIQYTLGIKIKVIILVDLYTTRLGFINEKFVKIIYKKLEIQPQHLIKLNFIQRFDGRVAKPVIHIIYPILFMRKYNQSMALLLISRFGQHPIIFSCL